ncbi:MAG: hypothetical protein sL5_10210 [Candidatus Mesenet longicola]|uniref:Ankyrin repeats (3 copies) n=1 Tax=Candidatus Mesenet longicola TaxID=1892558 RepID=A0A8J3HR09_9RICK|nr:MAG: hypothetical protein sGL2_10670 [Candidatus Mesenet longicola]GHM60028.1 MAG: hypothetical protein sL5_10210 [Candidatus Mesenet longicola]
MRNLPKDKVKKVKKLLPQIQNVNKIDLNNNTKTIYSLANQKCEGDFNWASTVNQLDLKVHQESLDVELQSAQQSTRAHKIYQASGLKSSLHGNIYQLKLLMLFLKRGMNKGYNFHLATEWDMAEKFDDLVFRYTDNQGQTKYRFLQAKHKQDEDRRITIGDLLTTNKNGEFNLEKYFISYLKIKNNQSFQDGDIQDLIICTNIGFDLDSSLPTQFNEIKSGKNKEKKISVEEITGNDDFFKKSDGGTRYKLQANNNLIMHLKQGSEAQKAIQAKNIQNNVDTEINNFLKKLTFAVNQPNELKLSNIISHEVGEEFKLFDADLVTDNFLKEMLDWIKQKEGTFLTIEDCRQFFEFAERKVSSLKIIGLTSRYSKKLKQYNINFKSTQLVEIRNFLNQKQKQVLNLKSQHNTKLNAIRVNQFLVNNNLYKAEDSYIFLPLNHLLLLKNKALDAFGAQDHKNLLIVECKKEVNNVFGLYSSLINIIKNNTDKKVILITRNGNSFADKFEKNSAIKGKYQERSVSVNSLDDLKSESRKKILNKTVNFQGNETSLSNLINNNQKHLINEEVLAQLIDNNEIRVGSMAPKLTGIDKECYIERKFNRKGGENIEVITDKVAIIVVKSGMGKSVVLTHLAEQEKINNPSLWVIKINLVEHIQALSEENFDDYNKSKAIDFLSRIIGLSTALEKSLFTDSFNYVDKVALFFDGFNEVSSTSRSNAIKLFVALRETQLKRLWIITRNYTCDELANGLDIDSLYELNPLSKNEQKEFLKKFFQNYLNHKNYIIDKTRLENCIQEFFRTFTSGTNINEDFLSVPLQLQIVAELLQNKFEEFYNGNQGSSLFDGFNLTKFYDGFIKCKFDEYSSQQEGYITPSNKLSFDEFLKQRQFLAFYALFGEKETESLFPEKIDKIKSLIVEMEKGNGCVGIVDRIIDGKPNFVHFTFAEYLVAKKFFDIFLKQRDQLPTLKSKASTGLKVKYLESKQKKLKKFFKKQYFSSNRVGIRIFFDHIAAKDSLLHIAVLNNNNDKIVKLLDNNIVDVNIKDTFGRIALHLAITYHYFDIVETLTKYGADQSIKDELFI